MNYTYLGNNPFLATQSEIIVPSDFSLCFPPFFAFPLALCSVDDLLFHLFSTYPL